MSDREYLRRALLKGHVCPECGLTMLRFRKEAYALWGACIECGATFRSFKALFEATSKAMRWPGGSWTRWKKAHPDYLHA